MEWIWKPAVVLVGMFIFVLCWLFFKDYTCCPCKNTRLPSDDVESCRSQSESRSRSPITAIDVGESSRGLPRTYPTPIASCQAYYDDDGLSIHRKGLPSRMPSHLPKVLPHRPPTVPPKPLTPHLTTLIDYDFGYDGPSSDIVKIQMGAPTIDLHQLTVKEAKQVTMTFLKQSRGKYRRLRIITGRGLHSVNGVPKIKPAVEALLNEYNYSFKETARGGCLEVTL